MDLTELILLYLAASGLLKSYLKLHLVFSSYILDFKFFKLEDKWFTICLPFHYKYIKASSSDFMMTIDLKLKECLFTKNAITHPF